jgi:N-acetylmuramoyl-L-alanine amidase
MTDASLQVRVHRLDNAVHHGGTRIGAPTMLIVHCTAGDSALSSIAYLNATTDKKASYHYVVDRDGTIYRMTDPALIAFHAGDSAWPLRNPGPHQGASLNAVSLGLAFANRDDGEPLTPVQLESGLWLGRTLTTLNGIRPELHRGHFEVSPKRKTDPHPKALDMNWWRAAVTEPFHP